jgi:hypothetical protein
MNKILSILKIDIKNKITQLEKDDYMFLIKNNEYKKVMDKFLENKIDLSKEDIRYFFNYSVNKNKKELIRFFIESFKPEVEVEIRNFIFKQKSYQMYHNMASAYPKIEFFYDKKTFSMALLEESYSEKLAPKKENIQDNLFEKVKPFIDFLSEKNFTFPIKELFNISTADQFKRLKDLDKISFLPLSSEYDNLHRNNAALYILETKELKTEDEIEKFKYLFSFFDPLYKNENGDDALSIAIAMNNHEIVQYLLSFNYNLDAIQYRKDAAYYYQDIGLMSALGELEQEKKYYMSYTNDPKMLEILHAHQEKVMLEKKLKQEELEKKIVKI